MAEFLGGGLPGNVPRALPAGLGARLDPLRWRMPSVMRLIGALGGLTDDAARALLGLPDVTKANEAYVENVTKLMKGAGGIEQLQEIGKQIAPMGQMGLQLFQQLIETGVVQGGMLAKAQTMLDSLG